MFRTVFASLFCLLTTLLPAQEQRAVLVTGASSGIGRVTAERLAKEGFFVYAGARKQQDLDELNAIENVQALRLDVTVEEDISSAVEIITNAGRGLYGLINNAGVAVLAPLIELREDDLKFQFDVNVYGPYRVTKAFAPLLIESKGCVVTTGSLSGTASWAMGGAYCMSKHAVEAYTDCLAKELRPFGVHVACVQPGNYKSKIMLSMRDRMLKNGYTTKGSRYERHMQGLLGQPRDRSQYQEPVDVAKAFVRILNERAQRRFLVVPNRGEAELTVRAAIERVAQLNRDQAYKFDRSELIEMLDKAIAAQK